MKQLFGLSLLCKGLCSMSFSWLTPFRCPWLSPSGCLFRNRDSTYHFMAFYRPIMGQDGKYRAEVSALPDWVLEYRQIGILLDGWSPIFRRILRRHGAHVSTYSKARNISNLPCHRSTRIYITNWIHGKVHWKGLQPSCYETIWCRLIMNYNHFYYNKKLEVDKGKNAS